MKTRLPVTLALFATLAVLLFGGASSSGARPVRLPVGFFGIAPQTVLGPQDIGYMQAGGIETIRVPFSWGAIQPTPTGGYDWSGVDQTIELAARGGLRVLPFLAGTPRWLGKTTTLPIDSARQRSAWTAFVSAAVKRYGPGGEFWSEHSHEGVNYEPALPRPLPVREWQIWNEVNFFYFAYPVSAQRYGKLLTLTSKTIKRIKPGAKIVLSGLFGEPTASGKRGVPADVFLQQLYRYPGIKSRFDAIALHPYAVDTEALEEMVESVHNVVIANHDRPGLYITEMGWGSQNDFQKVAFEQGIRGQVRELKGAYSYLIANQRRLNLKQVHWFSWKDAAPYCNFCDSVGLFREGAKFKPKPAWHAFLGFTGGRARP